MAGFPHFGGENYSADFGEYGEIYFGTESLHGANAEMVSNGPIINEAFDTVQNDGAFGKNFVLAAYRYTHPQAASTFTSETSTSYMRASFPAIPEQEEDAARIADNDNTPPMPTSNSDLLEDHVNAGYTLGDHISDQLRDHHQQDLRSAMAYRGYGSPNLDLFDSNYPTEADIDPNDEEVNKWGGRKDALDHEKPTVDLPQTPPGLEQKTVTAKKARRTVKAKKPPGSPKQCPECKEMVNAVSWGLVSTRSLRECNMLTHTTAATKRDTSHILSIVDIRTQLLARLAPTYPRQPGNVINTRTLTAQKKRAKRTRATERKFANGSFLEMTLLWYAGNRILTVTIFCDTRNSTPISSLLYKHLHTSL
jgi:hypothetical protein